MATLTVILVDGSISGAILFLLSVGLTLIYGVLRILNLAHGSIYALGAYTASFLVLRALGVGFGAYWSYVMLLAGGVIVGLVVGPVVEGLFLRRGYGRAEAIQLLLTFALFLLLANV